MLTHDADHADKDFIERFTSGCKYAAALYTTHGHTPENPRVRIIVPFTRDVTPDEFTAIGRYFAEEWGIDQFDESQPITASSRTERTFWMTADG